jgi:hypothetical protein
MNARKIMFHYVIPIALGFVANEIVYYALHGAWWFNLVVGLTVTCVAANLLAQKD